MIETFMLGFAQVIEGRRPALRIGQGARLEVTAVDQRMERISIRDGIAVTDALEIGVVEQLGRAHRRHRQHLVEFRVDRVVDGAIG